MKCIHQAGLSLLTTVAMLVVAGCTSLQPEAANTQVTGIMCDKCESVWFPKAGPGGKPGSGHLVYRASRRMICPQCENIAATFLRTGRITHVCPGCRGNITRCTAQMAAQRSTSGQSDL